MDIYFKSDSVSLCRWPGLRLRWWKWSHGALESQIPSGYCRLWHKSWKPSALKQLNCINFQSDFSILNQTTANLQCSTRLTNTNYQSNLRIQNEKNLKIYKHNHRICVRLIGPKSTLPNPVYNSLIPHRIRSNSFNLRCIKPFNSTPVSSTPPQHDKLLSGPIGSYSNSTNSNLVCRCQFPRRTRQTYRLQIVLTTSESSLSVPNDSKKESTNGWVIAVAPSAQGKLNNRACQHLSPWRCLSREDVFGAPLNHTMEKKKGNALSHEVATKCYIMLGPSNSSSENYASCCLEINENQSGSAQHQWFTFWT